MSAPVVAVLATDRNYVERVPELFPVGYDARAWFGTSPAGRVERGFRNATLQAGYFIIAVRAVGRDCGPMSGFDASLVEGAFFCDRPWTANILVNLGSGANTGPFQRKPRLSRSDACLFCLDRLRARRGRTLDHRRRFP